jgi:exodeoxyribonuclease V alpha subunit
MERSYVTPSGEASWTPAAVHSPTDTPFSGEVRVRNRRFVNEDTGFAVLDCTTGDDRLTLVGLIAHLEQDERAEVSGRWARDPRYGPQVRVDSALPLPPSDADALADYLRRVKHIGERRAERLLERHGTAVLDAIDRDPPAAFRAVGLSARRAAEAAASWDALRAMRELHLLLAPHGLAYLVTRVHKEYGDGAHRVVWTEPYGLTSVFGVGFQIADRIARGLGVDAGDPARKRAAVLHVLSEAERDGSTCLPRGQLLQRATELLGVGALQPALVDELASEGDVVILDGDWIYRRQTAELEEELAERVGELLSSEPAAALKKVRASRGDAAVPGNDELTEAQRAGVQAAFAKRLSILTGGPGTGKTASIRTIVAVAEEHKLRVILAAPTGRAAVRMSHATGIDATTVHSALGWIPGSGPSRDEDYPLECDILTIDETSMANLELLVTLLRAVGPETNVVLVGDADQLAPVGAGKPFADLVATEAVPTAKLEQIFRQAAGSMIVQGAHRVRRGLVPSFAADDGMKRDLYFIDSRDPPAARETVVKLVAERLPSHFEVDPVDDIQVFAPMYRGELGIDALNRDLREALNPAGEKTVGGFRLGDKLMLSGRNLHELGLMNGTLLRLLEAWADDDGDTTLLVRADDTTFEVSDEELAHLRLAYACSVHKGQGIELPIAVLIAHPDAGGWFFRREMLYTAMTRATHATVIVGDRSVVERAVRSADTVRRHSRFPWRIQRLIEGASG